MISLRPDTEPGDVILLCLRPSLELLTAVLAECAAVANVEAEA